MQYGNEWDFCRMDQLKTMVVINQANQFEYANGTPVAMKAAVDFL